jgi:hypothetical protein
MKMTYKEQITVCGSHDELKVVGAKLFKAKNLSDERRFELIKLYREKRKDLDRVMVDDSTNTELKRILYRVNTLAQSTPANAAKIGKSIYDLTKSGVLNRHEADLAFRAYRHQKRKAGIEFQPQAA